MLLLGLRLESHGQLSAETCHLRLPLEREGVELLAVVDICLLDFLIVLHFQIVLNGLLSVLPNLSNVVKVLQSRIIIFVLNVFALQDIQRINQVANFVNKVSLSFHFLSRLIRLNL